MSEFPEEIILMDGSGLSHDNRIAPNHSAQLLTWVYKEATFKDVFIDGLPVSGVDGCLKWRMQHKSVRSKVQAKTGNLPGITALSGYVTPKNDRPLLFVIMVNRRNKSAVEFKHKLEDPLCTLLATHAFSTF